jgi:signal transduction histidine kinase
VGWFDGRPLMRVLVQLIDNGIKFSPHGGDILVRIQLGDAAELSKHKQLTQKVSTASALKRKLLCKREFKYAPVQDKQCLLLVTVTDKGTGMEKNQQAALFDRFSQGDMTDTRAYGGIGLGLALSVTLVEKELGGHIWIEESQSEKSLVGKPTDMCTGTTMAFCAMIDLLEDEKLKQSAPYQVEQELFSTTNPRSRLFRSPRYGRRRVL